MASGQAPSEIKPIYRLMAVDKALGMSNNEIAEKYKYSVSRVSIIFQSPLMRSIVQDLQSQVEQKLIDKATNLSMRFDRLAPRAVDRLEDLMDHSEMDTVKLASAKEILDRSPNAPKARKLVDVEARGVVLQIPAVAMDNMLQAARIIGEPLDVQYAALAGEEEEDFDDYFDGTLGE